MNIEDPEPGLLGMVAYDLCEQEWDNPFHPSLDREEYLEWLDGYRQARDAHEPDGYTVEASWGPEFNGDREARNRWQADGGIW